MVLGGLFSLAGLVILHEEYFGSGSYQVTALENMEMVVWATSATVGMIGGAFAAFRRDLGIALTGGVFCIVAGFPVYYVGMIPGMVGVVLLILARKEFP